MLLDLREVPDAEVSALHACADAAVLAYRDVFSSGALLLALSFGLPVVAPDVGTAAELLVDGAGELFAPEGLTAALESMRRADQDARGRAAAASPAAMSGIAWVARRVRCTGGSEDSALRRFEHRGAPGSHRRPEASPHRGMGRVAPMQPLAGELQSGAAVTGPGCSAQCSGTAVRRFRRALLQERVKRARRRGGAGWFEDRLPVCAHVCVRQQGDRPGR